MSTWQRTDAATAEEVQRFVSAFEVLSVIPEPLDPGEPKPPAKSGKSWLALAVVALLMMASGGSS